MVTVTLSINGRDYDMACEADQADRIQTLGRDMDARARWILKQVGNVPDTRLMLMVGLMLADELMESQDKLAKLGEQTGQSEQDVARLEQLVLRAETLAFHDERD